MFGEEAGVAEAFDKFPFGVEKRRKLAHGGVKTDSELLTPQTPANIREYI